VVLQNVAETAFAFHHRVQAFFLMCMFSVSQPTFTYGLEVGMFKVSDTTKLFGRKPYWNFVSSPPLTQNHLVDLKYPAAFLPGNL
jgi:hypothetical protein